MAVPTAGRAELLQLAEHFNAKVVDLLPGMADAVKDPRFKQITLEHLITMSSGMQ